MENICGVLCFDQILIFFYLGFFSFTFWILRLVFDDFKGYMKWVLILLIRVKKGLE
jgi:hypothetical protein